MWPRTRASGWHWRCLSSAALHLKPRDRWLKCSLRHVKERRHLIAQNARFLVLPSRGRWPNLASRVLKLVGERLARDWQAHFGHPVQIAVPLDTNEEAAHAIKANCRQLTSFSRWPAIPGASKSASITAATAPKTRTVARCANQHRSQPLAVPHRGHILCRTHRPRRGGQLSQRDFERRACRRPRGLIRRFVTGPSTD